MGWPDLIRLYTCSTGWTGPRNMEADHIFLPVCPTPVLIMKHEHVSVSLTVKERSYCFTLTNASML